MLKLLLQPLRGTYNTQPPSGGCVLKLRSAVAAHICRYQPPSGGCVLKLAKKVLVAQIQNPAAFRRLCVETSFNLYLNVERGTSRLQAAVC